MLDDSSDLIGSQIELVLPNVSVFEVAVLLHLLIIGRDRKEAGVTSEDSFESIQNASFAACFGGVICGVIGKRCIFGPARRIDSQQRVTEGRRGIVEKRARKDKCRAEGINV